MLLDEDYNGTTVKIFLEEKSRHYPQICRVLDINDERIELVGQDGVKDEIPLDKVFMIQKVPNNG